MSNRTKKLINERDIVVRVTTPIVNFEPMDVVDIANTIFDSGKCFMKQKDVRLLCYTEGWKYRKWIAPLVSKGWDWRSKTPVDSTHLIGMKIEKAREMYDFIQKIVFSLRQIPSEASDSYRIKLIAYNKMINDTIKICERRL
jgi:hypothetical protein